MLDKEQIQNNKQMFNSLIRSIKREGADIEGLLNKLENSDFYIAPASIKFHNNFEGGLVQHSLNVYKNLKYLCSLYNSNIDEDSIIITSLLHDFDKMNKYEKVFKNVKKYSPNGSKRDEGGNFDWVSETGYQPKDAKYRFVFSHHGHNSEYMASTFIPLKLEESAAIVNHMGSTQEEGKIWDFTPVMERYTLAALLHAADFLACYVDERKYE